MSALKDLDDELGIDDLSRRGENNPYVSVVTSSCDRLTFIIKQSYTGEQQGNAYMVGSDLFSTTAAPTKSQLPLNMYRNIITVCIHY